MIRSSFLSVEDRAEMIALARDGSVAHRLARRANALVLLDAGWSCEKVAKVLFVDDDTVRQWYGLYKSEGFDGLAHFDAGGSACKISSEQQVTLKAWIEANLPRSTRQIGAYIKAEFDLTYEGRSGLVALLHRMGCVWRKPEIIPRKLDEDKQQAFITAYQQLLTSMGQDQAVLFADAVHPTHAARAVGCWAPSDCQLAIEQTSGRQRLTIHGAIDLQTGKTRMIEADAADARSTIQLLTSIEMNNPDKTLIHVYLDNARYHHAKLVQNWLTEKPRRIRLHFIPAYCPHLNPIERLWGVMHHNLTHNKTYERYTDFADAILGFLRKTVPENWQRFQDRVTDNFRIISNKHFRVLT